MKKEILQDVRHGKKLNWREKKVQSLKLADSFHRLGENKRAGRILFCGSELTFRRDLETGEKTLEHANFCRERLCPMCQWRRSLKIFRQVSQVMDKVEQQQPDLVPIFLTLTMRNCEPEKLGQTVDEIFQGWYQLTKHRKIKRVGQGWFRALEVTYNEKQNTFHPHLHAILLVDKGYFKKANKDYMQTTDWVQMWRKAMGLDYDPICDVRRLRSRKSKYKSLAEVAKYTFKDREIFRKDEALMDKLVGVLAVALKNRRLYAFGGVMKKAAKEIGMEQPGEGDLVHIEEDEIRTDVATMIEVYRWNFGVANYVRD